MNNPFKWMQFWKAPGSTAKWAPYVIVAVAAAAIGIFAVHEFIGM